MEAQVLLNAPARSIARQRSELAGLVEPHGTGSGCNHDAEERPGMIKELQLPWLGGRRLGVSSDSILELPEACRALILRRAVAIGLVGAALTAGPPLNVEPVIFLGRQGEQGLMKSSLNRSHRLLARLLLLGPLLLLDQPFEVSLERLERHEKSGVAVVLNNAAAGAGGEV